MTTDLDDPPVTSSTGRRLPQEVLLVVAALLVAVGLSRGPLATPATIDRLVVDNPTEYDLQVTARGPDERSSVAIATVSRGQQHLVEEVIDQGDSWVFHFAGQGRDGADLTVSRDDLARAGWVLTVPDEIAQDLRSKGAPPTPLTGGRVAP